MTCSSSYMVNTGLQYCTFPSFAKVFCFAFGATVTIHLLHCQKTADNLEIIKSSTRNIHPAVHFLKRWNSCWRFSSFFWLALPVSARFCGITSVRSIGNFQPNVRLRDILMLLPFIRNQYSEHQSLTSFLNPGVLDSHHLLIYIFICCQLSLLLCLQ